MPEQPEQQKNQSWLEEQAKALGFSNVSKTEAKLAQAKDNHLKWIQNQQHGEMHYLEKNIDQRFQPDLLVNETQTILSLTMPYIPNEQHALWQQIDRARLEQPSLAYVSRYSFGRDYHKILRQRLIKLAEYIKVYLALPEMRYRVFTDSAPIPEVEIASQSKLGFRGKHTLLINTSAGSMFFIGEIFFDQQLDFPLSKPAAAHCGSCTKCIDVCPTQAIIAPYQIDARKCISYLTIEHKGPIPHELRPLVGNRIYGCDDCQLFCPWNKFAKQTTIKDFDVRHQLHSLSLFKLLQWSEKDFQEKMAGSSIYRIGFHQWMRNILLSIGNFFSGPISAAEKQQTLEQNQLSIEQIEAIITQYTHSTNEVVSEQANWTLNCLRFHENRI